MFPVIEITADGSATLRSTEIAGADGTGETYHSLRGAVGEARHVFIEAGFKSLPPPSRDARVLLLNKEESLRDGNSPPCKGGVAGEARRGGNISILEMGFGTGLNAWLTLKEVERTGQRVEYTTVELHPVPEEMAAALAYTSDARFMAMHGAPWGELTEIDERFSLQKLHGNIVEMVFDTVFDLVYWDAFALDTQPELWTAELFTRIFEAMSPGGILVTYSSKGDVRRALQTAGFTIEKLPGALGKRHMLRAYKNYELRVTSKIRTLS